MPPARRRTIARRAARPPRRRRARRARARRRARSAASRADRGRRTRPSPSSAAGGGRWCRPGRAVGPRRARRPMTSAARRPHRSARPDADRRCPTGGCRGSSTRARAAAPSRPAPPDDPSACSVASPLAGRMALSATSRSSVASTSPPWLIAFFNVARSAPKIDSIHRPTLLLVGRLSCSSRKRSSSSDISCALWKRCVRIARPARAARSRPAPAEPRGAARSARSIGRERTASIVATSVLASNSRAPVRHSHSTMPRQKTSVRRSTGAPSSCSGAQ